MDVFGYPLRPDHYGTCEQALGEAMCAGVVPVVINNPCERMIVKEGVTGFLCKNEEEYIDNIVHLYHKPHLRKHMGQMARASAEGQYDIEVMIDAWNWQFENIMEEPKKERKPVNGK
jgi:glycosyltransferase involved in cell wall biosynthesis